MILQLFEVNKMKTYCCLCLIATSRQVSFFLEVTLCICVSVLSMMHYYVFGDMYCSYSCQSSNIMKKTLTCLHPHDIKESLLFLAAQLLLQHFHLCKHPSISYIPYELYFTNHFLKMAACMLCSFCRMYILHT